MEKEIKDLKEAHQAKQENLVEQSIGVRGGVKDLVSQVFVHCNLI